MVSENDKLKQHREFLKDAIRRSVDFSRTDQNRGISPPPLEKPFPEDGVRIELPDPLVWREQCDVDVVTAIGRRVSHRRFQGEHLTMSELSLLLWASQGIREPAGPGSAFRTVPSAGCRHAFETYLCMTRGDMLEHGLYRYLPVEHQLLLVRADDSLRGRLVAATFGQTFVATAPVTFIWAVLPYRMEWRYGPAAHKVIALDAGHVCQNLYLACEVIGAGTCAIAAYHQELMDELIGVDGEDEFTIYLAPVGKV